jgi:hypothetical protein
MKNAAAPVERIGDLVVGYVRYMGMEREEREGQEADD